MTNADGPTHTTPADRACNGCPATLLGMALLHELSDIRVKLRMDDDRSGAFDRLLGKLGAYEQISRTLAPNGAVYDPSHAPERATLRTLLKAHQPLLSRLEDPQAEPAVS